MQAPPFSPSGGPPTAPPIKKQRGSSTPQGDKLSLQANDALSRRRAELSRLQQLQQQGTSATTQALLSRAFNTTGTAPSFKPHGYPPTSVLRSTSAAMTRGAPPIPKAEPNGSGPRRTSDIFPTAPKLVSEAKPLPKGPPPTGATPTARRLDVSFAARGKPPATGRPKSAPPSRPTPPAGPPPNRVSTVPVTRGHIGRPNAVIPNGPPPPPEKKAPPSGAPPPSKPPPTGAPPAIGALPKSSANLSDGFNDGDNTPPIANKKTVQMDAAVNWDQPKKPLTLFPSQANVPAKTDITKSPLAQSPYATKPPVVFGNNAPPLPITETLKHPGSAGRPTTPTSGAMASSNAGQTPFYPKNTQSNAGVTPFAKNESTSASTPFPKREEEVVTLPSTAHKDQFHDIRSMATTPYKSANLTSALVTDANVQESPELRMQKELLSSEKDKKKAFNQVALLEDTIRDLQGGKPLADDLTYVVQIAKTHGEKAALEYARQKVSGKEATIPILSPMLYSPTRKRTGTPHPKRRHEVVESSDAKPFLMEAVDSLAFEYVEEGLATITIRRPYGFAANEQKLWFSKGELNNKMYEKSSDVHMLSSLEVVATIEADKSHLLLYGVAMARHQNAADGSWKSFGDVEKTGATLGEVTFTNAEGHMESYYLDEIYEAAQAAREHYCGSVVATAEALRMKASHKSPSTIAVAKSSDSSDATEKSQGSLKTESKPKMPPEDEPSIVGSFISFFFSTLASLLWYTFVRVPLNIFAAVIYLLIGSIVLSLMYLYIAEEHGVGVRDASIQYTYNSPGIL
jgi:hypothetical protein